MARPILTAARRLALGLGLGVVFAFATVLAAATSHLRAA
jgi:hypothetical protein